jgi:hypothetical protein
VLERLRSGKRQSLEKLSVSIADDDIWANIRIGGLVGSLGYEASMFEAGQDILVPAHSGHDRSCVAAAIARAPALHANYFSYSVP